MPQQLEKLEAHASHLLDSFIRLRERYALLAPMLFNEQVPKVRGSGLQARGFLTLRHSLFLSCAQDIAKLSIDNHKRTPSINNLVSALNDRELCNILRERFATMHCPAIEAETDPQIIEVLKYIELSEEADRRMQFDEILAETQKAWDELSSSASMNGFLTIRDQVSAHTEVKFVADKYQLVDIESLGIKWSDMNKTIERMQDLVQKLSLLVRNSGFAWEMLDEQLSKASIAFWLPAK